MQEISKLNNDAVSNEVILRTLSDKLAQRYGKDLNDLRETMALIPNASVSMSFHIDGHIPSDGPNTVRRTSFVLTPIGGGELEVTSSLDIDVTHDDDAPGDRQVCGQPLN